MNDEMNGNGTYSQNYTLCVWADENCYRKIVWELLWHRYILMILELLTPIPEWCRLFLYVLYVIGGVSSLPFRHTLPALSCVLDYQRLHKLSMLLHVWCSGELFAPAFITSFPCTALKLPYSKANELKQLNTTMSKITKIHSSAGWISSLTTKKMFSVFSWTWLEIICCHVQETANSESLVCETSLSEQYLPHWQLNTSSTGCRQQLRTFCVICHCTTMLITHVNF